MSSELFPLPPRKAASGTGHLLPSQLRSYLVSASGGDSITLNKSDPMMSLYVPILDTVFTGRETDGEVVTWYGYKPYASFFSELLLAHMELSM